MSQAYTTAHWRALGSDCTLVVYDPRKHSDRNQVDLVDTVSGITEEFEQRFSRFLSTSELTRFNEHPGGKFQVSEELYKLLREAQRVHQETRGYFDPTVIASLRRYGYVDADTVWPLTAPTTTRTPTSPPFTDLSLEKNNFVQKPAGLELDLGGIGKTFLLRQISETALHSIPNYYLSLGGDIIVKGVDGRHEGWLVEIDHITNEVPELLETLISPSGSICTSGTARRHGIAGDTPWHHIIDPSTRESLQTPVLAATALGDDPIWTEQAARLALKEYEKIDSAWMRTHHCRAVWIQLAASVKTYTLT